MKGSHRGLLPAQSHQTPQPKVLEEQPQDSAQASGDLHLSPQAEKQVLACQIVPTVHRRQGSPRPLLLLDYLGSAPPPGPLLNHRG